MNELPAARARPDAVLLLLTVGPAHGGPHIQARVRLESLKLQREADLLIVDAVLVAHAFGHGVDRALHDMLAVGAHTRKCLLLRHDDALSMGGAGRCENEHWTDHQGDREGDP